MSSATGRSPKDCFSSVVRKFAGRRMQIGNLGCLGLRFGEWHDVYLRVVDRVSHMHNHVGNRIARVQEAEIDRGAGLQRQYALSLDAAGNP